MVCGGVWWCVVVCGGVWWCVVVSCEVHNQAKLRPHATVQVNNGALPLAASFMTTHCHALFLHHQSRGGKWNEREKEGESSFEQHLNFE